MDAVAVAVRCRSPLNIRFSIRIAIRRQGIRNGSTSASVMYVCLCLCQCVSVYVCVCVVSISSENSQHEFNFDFYLAFIRFLNVERFN